MPEYEARIRWTNAEEKAHFDRLMAEDERWLSWVQRGSMIAHEQFLPGLQAGHYGITERQIELGLRRMLKACYGSQRKDGALALDDDQRFMLRIGFEAVALPAKDGALAAVGIGASLFLGAVIAAAAKPALPTHRRLRAEDFGALPSRPRS